MSQDLGHLYVLTCGALPAPNIISIDKLVRLIGTSRCPTLIDVRAEDAFDADPRLIPSSHHSMIETLGGSSEARESQPAVVICHHGGSLSQGVAAWFRARGVPAEVLEGGFEAWRQARLPLVPVSNFLRSILKIEPYG